MADPFRFRIRLEITCADNVLLLNAISASNINMEDVSYKTDLTIHLTISNNDYAAVESICKKYDARVRIIKKYGAIPVLESIQKRPVLITFLCLLICMFCFLPSRILFVSVNGNTNIATNKILEAAEKCGICFGAGRRQVRSEKVKNALLQEIPELQWAGINTSGCTAIISVSEKTTQETTPAQNSQVSSIVASRDGVIQNCTVYQGNALCTVGQAVKAGQTLVSGYIDCGIVTKTTQADAEIKALTFREAEVISPVESIKRGEQQKEINRYCLLIGKKLIKLYKDSGNHDTSCAKIYSQRYVQLPGGFRLPISVVKETIYLYEDRSNHTAALDAQEWLIQYTENYLQSTMLAGEIISAETEITQEDNLHILRGRFACVEMIGQVKYEQTMIEGETK